MMWDSIGLGDSVSSPQALVRASCSPTPGRHRSVSTCRNTQSDGVLTAGVIDDLPSRCQTTQQLETASTSAQLVASAAGAAAARSTAARSDRTATAARGAAARAARSSTARGRAAVVLLTAATAATAATMAGFGVARTCNNNSRQGGQRKEFPHHDVTPVSDSGSLSSPQRWLRASVFCQSGLPLVRQRDGKQRANGPLTAGLILNRHPPVKPRGT